MKLFMDTANLDDLRFGIDSGLLDGVTTNPTLIAREGKPQLEQLRAICEVVPGPVSAEVVSVEADAMVAEGKALARIAGNIVIKIPIIADGLKAIKALRAEGIRVNATLIFSPLQALLAAKAGSDYVSPFVGRLDDVGHDGMEVVSQIVEIFDNYAFDCEVLVASVRNPTHLLRGALMGAHVATMPRSVFAQMIHHPLTDVGLKKFLEDAKKTPR